MDVEVIFPEWYDGRVKFEMTMKGYLSGVRVPYKGNLHELFFVDGTRLIQDLARSTEFGEPYFAERGTIVVNDVTEEIIIETITALAKQGFFDPPPTALTVNSDMI